MKNIQNKAIAPTGRSERDEFVKGEERNNGEQDERAGSMARARPKVKPE